MIEDKRNVIYITLRIIKESIYFDPTLVLTTLGTKLEHKSTQKVNLFSHSCYDYNIDTKYDENVYFICQKNKC